MITLDGFVLAVEATDFDFEHLVEKIRNKPTPPYGYDYRLRADTLEWELVELPPMPEPELTGEEALNILLGGAES